MRHQYIVCMYSLPIERNYHSVKGCTVRLSRKRTRANQEMKFRAEGSYIVFNTSANSLLLLRQPAAHANENRFKKALRSLEARDGLADPATFGARAATSWLS